MQPKETTKLSQSSTVPWQMSHANIHYKEDRTLTSVRRREHHLPGICLESGGGWELPAATGECARELKSCWRFPFPCKHRSFLQTEGKSVLSFPLRCRALRSAALHWRRQHKTHWSLFPYPNSSLSPCIYWSLPVSDVRWEFLPPSWPAVLQLPALLKSIQACLQNTDCLEEHPCLDNCKNRTSLSHFSCLFGEDYSKRRAQNTALAFQSHQKFLL